MAILSGGSEFDLRKTDERGHTALHWAGEFFSVTFFVSLNIF